MRYVLHPGDIKSKSDGQWHYIGVNDLMRLYGVRATDPWISANWITYSERADDVHLRPRFDGSYYDVHAEDK